MFGKFLKWLFGSGNISVVNLPLTSADVSLNIIESIKYLVTENDVDDFDKFSRRLGYYSDDLQAFNQVIKEEYFWGKLIERKAIPLKFEVGSIFYLPSTDETTLLAFSENFNSQEKAINQYKNFKNTDEENILNTAIKRAKGTIGKHYGTNSLIFLTPNKQLIGASENKTEVINNEKQYQVNWGADIWKCNIFMHDVVYDAGFETDIMENQHYITAGQLHKSEKYEELEIDVVKPGNLVQLYSGQGANQSHNMVLTTFINRSVKSNENEFWQFKAIGAEQDWAAISFRKYEIAINDDGYKIIDARFEQIRFFKPKFKRDVV